MLSSGGCLRRRRRLRNLLRLGMQQRDNGRPVLGPRQINPRRNAARRLLLANDV